MDLVTRFLFAVGAGGIVISVQGLHTIEFLEAAGYLEIPFDTKYN